MGHQVLYYKRACLNFFDEISYSEIFEWAEVFCNYRYVGVGYHYRKNFNKKPLNELKQALIVVLIFQKTSA